MGFGVPHQRILLLQYVLLAFLLTHVSVARRVRVEINQLLVDETSDLKRDGADDHRDNHVHQLGMASGAEYLDNPSSFHIDDSTKTSLVFFSPKDLKAGNRIPLYFTKKLAWTSKLLPRDEADSIPFSLKELPSLLKLFSIAQGSKQAEAMEDTLRMCEDPPLKGETKFCATSLESMLDFTLRVFGIGYSDHDNYPTFLTSTFHSTSESESESESISIVSFQNYTILETPKAILTPQMVGCHAMPYPYTVFHCHIKEGRSNVYKILFGGDNGDTLDAFAACHLDTSQWDHDHVSFRILGAEPGDPVCHIFPPHGNLLWIHKPTTSI